MSPKSKVTMFFVENDDLCDDWGAFDTWGEASAFVKNCCDEIAEANAPEGTCKEGRFAGMTDKAISATLYDEHKGSIEEREVKTAA